jgi:hypothetical protein
MSLSFGSFARWVIPALLLLPGCSLTGPEQPDLSISLQSEVDLPPGAVFRVIIDGRTHDLELGSERDTRYSIDRRAPRAGEFAVAASLVNASQTTLAAASFVQEYVPDADHWVSAWVGERRPFGHCIGTLVPIPIVVPLVAARADSMFVMYGRIPKGAVC